MTLKTRAALQSEAATIRDETSAGANTASRVGSHQYDIADSSSLRLISLGTFNPASIVFSQEGFYSQYTQSGDVVLNVPGTVVDGIGQVVYFLSNGVNSVSFNIDKFHINGGLYGITNGEVLAAGLWKLWLFSENGKVNVNVPANQAVNIPVLAFVSANIGNTADNIITIVMNDVLDETSVPATTDFSVSGITGSPTITNVSIISTEVSLTLSANALSSDSPLVSYTEGVNPLKDLSGNKATEFTDESVTNTISGEDADAAAWLDSFTYSPSAAERAAYDALFKGLKTDNVWTLMDAIFVRYSPDEDMGMKSLKGGFISSLTGGTPPTWSSKGGITSAGTGQCETDFNPAVDGVNFGGQGDGNFSMVYVASITLGSAVSHIMGLDVPVGGTTHSLFNDATANNRIGFNPTNSSANFKTSSQMQANTWYACALTKDAVDPEIKGFEDDIEVGSPGLAAVAIGIENDDIYELASNRGGAGYNRMTGTIYYSIYGGYDLKDHIAAIKSRFDTFKTQLDAA